MSVVYPGRHQGSIGQLNLYEFDLCPCITHVDNGIVSYLMAVRGYLDAFLTCSTGINSLRLCYHIRINYIITRLSIELKLKEGLIYDVPRIRSAPRLCGVGSGRLWAEGAGT